MEPFNADLHLHLIDAGFDHKRMRFELEWDDAKESFVAVVVPHFDDYSTDEEWIRIDANGHFIDYGYEPYDPDLDDILIPVIMPTTH